MGQEEEEEEDFILEFEEPGTSVEYMVHVDTFEHYYKIFLPHYMNTIADLKKALINKLYPNSPAYNYMAGDKMDNMVIRSAVTRQKLDIYHRFQYMTSHLGIRAGQEYILQVYKSDGNQYTLADYEDGQLEHPPPMMIHSTEDDNDQPDDTEQKGRVVKKRWYQ